MSSSSQSRLVLPSKRPRSDAKPEVVLISSKFAEGSPIGHAIYALQLPKDEADGPILPPHDLYPILEIPSNLLDPSMCCVQLKSRLYFLGGMSLAGDDTYLRDYWSSVYFIELDDLYAYAAAADSHDSQPLPPVSSLLRQGVPMKQGKPRCYAFAVEDKLYAIGYSPCPVGMDENQFEVFDPETDQWSSLPQPPYPYAVCSHALVGRNKQLIMGTVCPQFISIPSYFDILSNKWVEFYPKRIFSSVIPALFVGDSLYFHSGYEISSFGPIAADHDLSRLFDNLSTAPSELSQAIDVNDRRCTSKFLHLGNNTILYLMGVKLPPPEYC